MGVDAADYDQDGWMDLFVANVDHEMYSLYHNNQDEIFDDVAVPLGIGTATRLMSGWGLKFFDYDNDGNLDLLLCNGHPDDRIEDAVSRREVSRTPAAVSQHRERLRQCQPAERTGFRQAVFPAAAWPSATSTTTALWTSWCP